MGARAACEMPARLERLRQRFEQWRRSRQPRSRIPGRLWSAAVALAKIHGVNRTARTLRLDYYSLKDRVGPDEATVTRDPLAVPTTPPFIELSSPASTGLCQCRVELKAADGTKMRIRLKSAAMPDLAALGRSFWNRQP
jgi:hypothetical protein